jgi:hypothetical protein
MVPRRQSPLTSACENFAPGEFDALLATDFTPDATPDTLRADELLEWIEDSDVGVRFALDLTDEPFRNAA